MEPTDLTCTKCGATWKLIKAGSDPVACPNCKAPVEERSQAAPPEPAPTEPAAPIPPVQPEAAPAAVAPPSASVPKPARPKEESSIPETIHSLPVDDTDDPGLAADYDDRFDVRRRRGMNPVGKTIIIFLILIFLVPIALLILLFVVCAVLLSVG